MSGAHFHLMINHFPLFSILFGTLALVWFLFKKSPEILFAACLLFGLGGLTAILAVQSGEPAEKMIIDHPEVVKSMIHEHEEAGELAVILALALGVAGVGLILIRKYKPEYLIQAAWAVLVLAVINNFSMGRTALYGGPIRHSEIREDGGTDSLKEGSGDSFDQVEDSEEGADDPDQEFFEEEPSEEPSAGSSDKNSNQPKK